MPLDASRMKLDYGTLRNGVPTSGIGGTSDMFQEPAILAFADNQFIYAYSISLMICAPQTATANIPSLLRPNILDTWRLTKVTRRHSPGRSWAARLERYVGLGGGPILGFRILLLTGVLMATVRATCESCMR